MSMMVTILKTKSLMPADILFFQSVQLQSAAGGMTFFFLLIWPDVTDKSIWDRVP